MGFVSEFKEFISKGNVLDLAVGVIIGAAFSKIVSSLTDDIIMPILGIFTNGIDFQNMFVTLDGKHYETLAEAKKAGSAAVAYGNFINAIIYFLIIAFVIFWGGEDGQPLQKAHGCGGSGGPRPRHYPRPGTARRDSGGSAHPLGPAPRNAGPELLLPARHCKAAPTRAVTLITPAP